jgi:uncharacterized protein
MPGKDSLDDKGRERMDTDAVQFKSELGNSYVYDNVTGHIFNTSLADQNELRKFLEKYRLQVELENKNIKTNLKENDIREFLFCFANGFRQLILEITTACNFRCRYCTYSDNYEFTRSHGFDNMSVGTAQKAIDYYFKNYEVVAERNPTRVPVISFYGGEPLFNFPLVKHVVSYVKKQYKKYEESVSFHITTNGYLLLYENTRFLE